MVLRHEIKSAWRALWTQPRYVLLTGLLFSIGIGASVAVFSVMRATLLAPLGYEQPGRLIVVSVRSPATTAVTTAIGFTEVNAFTAQNRTLESLAAFRLESLTLTSQAEPAIVQALRISPGLLTVLGVRPGQGRDFRPDEADASAAPVALVSAAFCESLYGGEPCAAVGRSLTLDGRAHEIVGVLPARHRFPGVQYRDPMPEVWIPLVPRPDELRPELRSLRAVARMRPGVNLGAVSTDLDTIMARLAADDPATFEAWTSHVQLLSDSIAGRLRTPVHVAFVAALMLLATACVNAMSLIVSRHLGTLPERALRYALGASPRALLRYQLVENALLMLIGLAGGVLTAQLTLMTFRTMSAGALGHGVELRLEWGTLGFALLLAVLVVLVTTLATWALTRRLPLAPQLKESGKGLAGAGRRSRALDAVITAEFGFACALLAVGVTVFSQLQRLQSTSPGFNANSAWAVVFNLPPTQYATDHSQVAFYRMLERELAAAPGIEAIGVVARAPMIPGFPAVTFTVEGRVMPLGQEPDAHYRPATPGYFEAAGFTLKEGRGFHESEVLQGSDVVVVSERLARTQWPGDSAVGKRIYLVAETDRLRTVVGVAADSNISSLDEPPENIVYVPLEQNSWPNLLNTGALVMRSRLTESGLRPLVRNALQRVNPELPVPQVRHLEEVVQGSLAMRRFLGTLIFTFAGIAALLAVLGVYGAFDFAAASAVRDLAIRQALGASRRRLLLETLRRSGQLLSVGLVAGALLAYVLMQLARSFLLGWSPTEAALLAATTVALVIVAVVASCLPTRAILRRPIAAVIREAA